MICNTCSYITRPVTLCIYIYMCVCVVSYIYIAYLRLYHERYLHETPQIWQPPDQDSSWSSKLNKIPSATVKHILSVFNPFLGGSFLTTSISNIPMGRVKTLSTCVYMRKWLHLCHFICIRIYINVLLHKCKHTFAYKCECLSKVSSYHFFPCKHASISLLVSFSVYLHWCTINL